MTPSQIDATLTALADPTRRAILARLAKGEASVMELAAPFSISQPAISKHLNMLEKAGLISRGRDGTRRPCRIEPKPLADAAGWLGDYCRSLESSYQRLDTLLAELQAPAKSPDEIPRRNQLTKSTDSHQKRVP